MRILLIFLLVLLSSCAPPPEREASHPPAWAQDAIWYQIFVERFRNGDPSNDPLPDDLIGSYPGFVPDDWALTPWTNDWYAPDPWFGSVVGRADDSGREITSFNQLVQLRRTGGDLQGVLDRIEYIDSLGISAVYFNPLNDAPSLHKYDPRHWRHIDRTFGPDPDGDAAIIATEIPHDPATWQMTSADRLFVEVIAALHARGIRVILDYSWNHTGREAWAFLDVKARGEESPYADWYWIDSFDDPSTPLDEFAFTGWAGVPQLPEMRETVWHDMADGISAYEGDLYSDALKQHIFHVSRRWLDPDGDGDPSDGVDGFRLDVAAEIGLGFWREYRSFVRSINPEAYLVGEVWWESWPDALLDPAPFVQGDVFDAVMNYRWYRSARRFFAEAPDRMPVTAFVDSLNRYRMGIPEASTYAMMNVAASHDTPRLSTSLYNPVRYKVGTTSGNPDYRLEKPDERTRETQRLLLAHQFTWVGAPHIWAGDEMGMWGDDDPSTRKPLVWPDLAFDDEATHPLGIDRTVDEVAFDRALFDYYRRLARIRSEHAALRSGDLTLLAADDERRLLAYRRSSPDGAIVAVFNASEAPARFEWDGLAGAQDLLGNARFLDGGIDLDARRAAILLLK